MTTEERIMLRNELVEEFKKYGIITYYKDRFKISSFKKLNDIISIDDQLKQKYFLYISQFKSKEEALYCIRYLDDITNHLCTVCKQQAEFYIYGKNMGYKKTCGDKKCITLLNSSKESIEKAKETNLKRYGVENPMQSKEIKDKVKQTNLERYGVESISQSQEIKSKIKDTILNRYGVDNIAKAQIIQQKIKDTCLEHYGVENVFQSEDIKSKIKQTLINRYGVDNPMKSKEFADKRKQKACSFDNPNHKHIRNFNIWINDDTFTQFIINQYNVNNRFLLISEICSFFNVKYNSIRRRIEALDLCQYFYIQESNLEVQFKDFLDINGIVYNQHDRRILYESDTNKRQEIDFLCADNLIGFEINDIASHNTIGNEYYSAKDKYYHRDKTLLASQYKTRLIHLWEWEFRNERLWNRLSNWILNILNNNKTRIFARKCIIKRISLKEEKKFLNEYHLQGYKKSQVCYGLCYDNQIVQVMSFCKPRYNKNYQYELLRLCAKHGYTIIGGAQKLLKRFIDDCNPTSIISYCDLSKFTGKVYENIGFELDHITEPQIIWCNKDMRHFSQTSLNMIGADKLLGINYGKGTDNVEIVMKHGYVPVYNCGHAVYILRGEIIERYKS